MSLNPLLCSRAGTVPEFSMEGTLWRRPIALGWRRPFLTCSPATPASHHQDTSVWPKTGHCGFSVLAVDGLPCVVRGSGRHAQCCPAGRGWQGGSVATVRGAGCSPAHRGICWRGDGCGSWGAERQRQPEGWQVSPPRPQRGVQPLPGQQWLQGQWAVAWGCRAAWGH